MEGYTFSGGGSRLTPLAKRLIIGLVVVFVIDLVLDNWIGISAWTGGRTAFTLLALDPRGIHIESIWQVITYVVALPAQPESVWSLTMAVIVIWFMVSPFEISFGPRRTLQLIFFAALAGGVLGLATGFVLTAVGLHADYLFGTGPVSFAFLAAFAIAMGDRPISFVFLPSMQFRAINMLWVSIGFSVLQFLASRNWVALAADAGGIGAAVLFVKWMNRPRPPKKPPAKRKAPPHGLRVIEGGEGDGKPRWLN